MLTFEPLPYPPEPSWPVENTDKFATYAALEAFISSVPGWTKENLGPSSAPEMDIFGFSYGDVNNKPVLWLEANIHGLHEWRSTHWMVAFMKLIADGAVEGRAGRLLDVLKRECAFYIVPSLNPYGYINSVYYNGNGVNLNRNFPAPSWGTYPDEPGGTNWKGPSAGSEPETQAVMTKVQALKPLLFVDCHSEGGLPGFSVGGTPVALQKRALESIGGVVGDDGGTPTWYWRNRASPTSTEWARFEESRNTNILINSVTFESGTGMSNLQQGISGVNGLLALCAYAFGAFRFGTPDLTDEQWASL